VVLVLLLGGVISVGVDGAGARAAGFFLCACFELGALAFVAEWFSQATCPVAITSKPLKPKPRPTFANRRSEVREEREVWGGTWMRWAGFEASAVSAVPCDDGAYDDGGRWGETSL
jgi:hypothetical protein